MGVRFMRKAQVAFGKRDEAMAFSADVVAHWKDTYKVDITWGLELGGDNGMMYWFSDHASLAELESILQASMNNAETNKILDQGNDLFVSRAQDKLIYTL